MFSFFSVCLFVLFEEQRVFIFLNPSPVCI